MQITHLKHHQIDKERWDYAIENSTNPLIYALSWFMDIFSPNWEALILGNYEFIMPLTWRKKIIFKYLYQPMFIQQLGIFSAKEVKKDIQKEFIKKLKNKYKLIDIQLNYANPALDSEHFILRNTQLIDLSIPYTELYRKYKKNHRKNLKKIYETELMIDRKGECSDFVDLTRKMFAAKAVDEITDHDIVKLEKVVNQSLKLKIGEFYFGHLNGEICAAAYFLKWKKRVIVYTALNDTGREVGAMFGLIDKYLKENAGKDLLFDFAGSNIPGVKYRNLGFGARNEVYYRVTITNLPIPFKWFKK